MDSITHIAIGACLGEGFAGKTVGRKALLWGLLAQSLPDIDFLASPWLDTSSDLLFHRGFSHSILFATASSFILGLTAEKLHRPHNISKIKWIVFFWVSISLHLLLDSFNNYGVGIWEPFSSARISFNSIYILDPLLSIWPGLALILLLVRPQKHLNRKFWWRFGLIGVGIYLCFSLFNKWMIDKEARKLFAEQNVPRESYFTTPAPFQNIFWFVVAGNDSGFNVGYRSLFDTGKISLTYFPKNESWLKNYENRQDVKNLKSFSQGFYTVSRLNDSLMFNDLRFGQVIGWMEPHEKFAFHYFLDYPDDNNLVVQRGRFEKLGCVSITEYWGRIFGKKPDVD